MPRNKHKPNRKQGSQYNEQLLDDDIFNIMDNNPINNSDLNESLVSEKENKTIQSVVPIVEDISPKRAGRFERKNQKENVLRRTLTAIPPEKNQSLKNNNQSQKNNNPPIEQKEDNDISDILNEFPKKQSSATIEFEKPRTSEKIMVAETPSYTLYEELEIDPAEELKEPEYKVCDMDNDVSEEKINEILDNSIEKTTTQEKNEKPAVVFTQIDIDTMDVPIVDDMPERENQSVSQENSIENEEKPQRLSITQALEEVKDIPSYAEDSISEDDVLKVMLENDNIPAEPIGQDTLPSSPASIETSNSNINDKVFEENLVQEISRTEIAVSTENIFSKEENKVLKEVQKAKENVITDEKIIDKIDTAKKELNIKVRHKKGKINLKSTPDVDFLEIDSLEEPQEQNNENVKKRKKKGFDDFHKKEDAEALFNDLLDLRGGIVFRVALLTLLTFISGYISLANNYNLPTIDILRADVSSSSFIFIQLIISLIAMVSSLNLIISGIKKFFMMKSDCDTLSALAFVATFIASLCSLSATEMIGNGIMHIYIPVAIMSLLFNAIGKLVTVDRAINNFEVVSANSEHYAIMCVENEELSERITRGTFVDYPILVKMQKTGFLMDFLKYTYSYDIADKYCKTATPIIAGVSALLAIISAILFRNSFIGYEWQVGLGFFALLISTCACFGMTLLVNIPLWKASEKYPSMAGALLGYQSVDDFYDANSFMVDADTIFPRGTVRLSAIKTFSDTKIDDAIIDAASLTEYAGSIMRHMFNDVIAGDTTMLREVENYVYENSTGICGWINNKRVLLGNRELMVAHSIEGIPTKTKELEFTANKKEAVYLSVSGNLSAMFIVDIKPNFYIKQAFSELEHNNISVMVKSIDSIVTVSKIAEIFEVPQEMIKIIPEKLFNDYQTETQFVSKQSASMVSGNDFVTVSQLLISTKRIRKTAIMGLILQSVASLLGILIAIAFIILKSFDQLTTSMLLIYNLIWTILTVFTVYFRKE